MKSKGDLGSRSQRTDAGKAPPLPRGENFSRLLSVDDVPDEGLKISFRADEGECGAMARRAGLIGISDLEADLTVKKLPGMLFNVGGVLRARVTQACVISLDQFETELSAEIDVDFAPAATAKSLRASSADDEIASGAVESSGQVRDPPDPIVDSRIDLGALAEEFLILSLDPYPKKPGVSFDEAEISGDAVEKESPFAVLKKLTDET